MPDTLGRLGRFFPIVTLHTRETQKGTYIGMSNNRKIPSYPSYPGENSTDHPPDELP